MERSKAIPLLSKMILSEKLYPMNNNRKYDVRIISKANYWVAM